MWPIKGLKFIQKEYAAPKEYPKAIRDLVTLFECVNQVSNNQISFTKTIIIKNNNSELYSDSAPSK